MTHTCHAHPYTPMKPGKAIVPTLRPGDGDFGPDDAVTATSALTTR